MSSLIEFQKITKCYEMGDIKVDIIKGIDLTIDDHELVAIMGESGSGKTTILNMMGLLDSPTSGTYNLQGRAVSTLSQDEMAECRNTTIGFVFQSFNLLPRMTALQNVGLPLTYRKMRTPNIEKAASEMLSKIGMGDHTASKPYKLSGGQQQRVAIARALIGNPSVLLADEPTGALDKKTGQEIMKVFIDLNRDAGTTIVVITHDPGIAAQCKRMIRLVDGVIIDEHSLLQRK